MARKYTKVEQLVEIVRERHNQGETYGEIAASYGLERRQVKSLMERQRRKERMLAAVYIPRTKGRPCKEPVSEEEKQHKELAKLRMQVELLRNFLFEAGRRRGTRDHSTSCPCNLVPNQPFNRYLTD